MASTALLPTTAYPIPPPSGSRSTSASSATATAAAARPCIFCSFRGHDTAHHCLCRKYDNVGRYGPSAQSSVNSEWEDIVDPQGTRVYGRRWYVLLVFSLLAMLQSVRRSCLSSPHQLHPPAAHTWHFGSLASLQHTMICPTRGRRVLDLSRVCSLAPLAPNCYKNF